MIPLILYPKYYARSEGGVWEEWDQPPINKFQLHTRDRMPFKITVNGVHIHSLAFDDPGLGHNRFDRWDVVNGWTSLRNRLKGNVVKLPEKNFIIRQRLTTNEMAILHNEVAEAFLSRSTLLCAADIISICEIIKMKAFNCRVDQTMRDAIMIPDTDENPFS